jgi:hypothetical protein
MGLDTKTYWLTDRQSECDFDFDSESIRSHTLDNRSSIFIRDKPIFSSERMLHKDYDLKGSVERKISGRERQGAWLQDG